MWKGAKEKARSGGSAGKDQGRCRKGGKKQRWPFCKQCKTSISVAVGKMDDVGERQSGRRGITGL